LHPSEYILARLAFLERRARWAEGSGYGVEAVFRAAFRSQEKPGNFLSGDQRRRMEEKIRRGDMGHYLLLHWHQTAPRFFAGTDSETADSTRGIFRTWLRLRPHSPAALDSLGAGFASQKRWDSAEVYYRRALGYYPLGNPYAVFRLAWTLFQQERFEELGHWLKRCEPFRNEPKFQLMRGALAWKSGKPRQALAVLEKSLKLDKTLPETHAWLARVAEARGDSTAASLHRRWRKRTGP
jgi:tetratricopeptide (TPR) repeat protein